MANLEAMFSRASDIDLEEGMVAYERYHMVMHRIAEHYQYPLDRVIAVFVSLSPNNDYTGNLRSTVSVLQGVNEARAEEQITTSTYKHCRNRAIAYARGQRDFLLETKGPKIRNFFHNVLTPHDNRWVTVDGHMSAIWQGRNLSMKEALIRPKVYERIKHDISSLAFKHFLLPNQMQAILWFTRKRVDRIVYDPQLQLFGDPTDVWRTYRDIRSIQPYRNKTDAEKQREADARARINKKQAASAPRLLFGEQ